MQFFVKLLEIFCVAQHVDAASTALDFMLLAEILCHTQMSSKLG